MLVSIAIARHFEHDVIDNMFQQAKFLSLRSQCPGSA
jgi:hypothetical protein